MNHKHTLIAAIANIVLSHSALAECIAPTVSKGVDPVEVGFCEADAVFVGKVEQRLETIRAFREEGSDKTAHFKVEHSTVKVGDSYKGNPPESVKMIADLYKLDSAYSFQVTKEYLIFAKKLPEGNEYSGANACSVQSTLPMEKAKKALARLNEHRSGKKTIDCEAIRSSSASKP